MVSLQNSACNIFTKGVLVSLSLDSILPFRPSSYFHSFQYGQSSVCVPCVDPQCAAFLTAPAVQVRLETYDLFTTFSAGQIIQREMDVNKCLSGTQLELASGQVCYTATVLSTCVDSTAAFLNATLTINEVAYSAGTYQLQSNIMKICFQSANALDLAQQCTGASLNLFLEGQAVMNLLSQTSKCLIAASASQAVLNNVTLLVNADSLVLSYVQSGQILLNNVTQLIILKQDGTQMGSIVSNDTMISGYMYFGVDLNKNLHQVIQVLQQSQGASTQFQFMMFQYGLTGGHVSSLQQLSLQPAVIFSCFSGVSAVFYGNILFIRATPSSTNGCALRNVMAVSIDIRSAGLNTTIQKPVFDLQSIADTQFSGLQPGAIQLSIISGASVLELIRLNVPPAPVNNLVFYWPGLAISAGVALAAQIAAVLWVPLSGKIARSQNIRKQIKSQKQSSAEED